jgi:hypothetical protein
MVLRRRGRLHLQRRLARRRRIRLGLSYYVCCSVYKDLFNKGPEAILAEAAAQAMAKK